MPRTVLTKEVSSNYVSKCVSVETQHGLFFRQRLGSRVRSAISVCVWRLLCDVTFHCARQRRFSLFLHMCVKVLHRVVFLVKGPEVLFLLLVCWLCSCADGTPTRRGVHCVGVRQLLVCSTVLWYCVKCCDESRRETCPTITTTSSTGGQDRFGDVVLVQWMFI